MKSGNINTDEFEMACCMCGAGSSLCLTAHRNGRQNITGWVVLCAKCQGGKYDMQITRTVELEDKEQSK